MHVTGFNWSVSDSIINWSVSVSIFVFRFVSWITVTIAIPSLRYMTLLRRQRNETDIARQLFRECEQIYITVYGPDHSETVDAARQASRCV